nr:BPK_HP1_G0043490.mRNA.1.CDS.1 [Saccharomyces cerevisiae]
MVWSATSISGESKTGNSPRYKDDSLAFYRESKVTLWDDITSLNYGNWPVLVTQLHHHFRLVASAFSLFLFLHIAVQQKCDHHFGPNISPISPGVVEIT